MGIVVVTMVNILGLIIAWTLIEKNFKISEHVRLMVQKQACQRKNSVYQYGDRLLIDLGVVVLTFGLIVAIVDIIDPIMRPDFVSASVGSTPLNLLLALGITVETIAALENGNTTYKKDKGGRR